MTIIEKIADVSRDLDVLKNLLSAGEYKNLLKVSCTDVYYQWIELLDEKQSFSQKLIDVLNEQLAIGEYYFEANWYNSKEIFLANKLIKTNLHSSQNELAVLDIRLGTIKKISSPYESFIKVHYMHLHEMIKQKKISQGFLELEKMNLKKANKPGIRISRDSKNTRKYYLENGPKIIDSTTEKLQTLENEIKEVEIEIDNHLNDNVPVKLENELISILDKLSAASIINNYDGRDEEKIYYIYAKENMWYLRMFSFETSSIAITRKNVTDNDAYLAEGFSEEFVQYHPVRLRPFKINELNKLASELLIEELPCRITDEGIEIEIEENRYFINKDGTIRTNGKRANIGQLLLSPTIQKFFTNLK